jgi:cell division protease FtsH
MSDVAGLMVLEKQRNTFLQGGTVKEYSSKTAEKVDEYVKNFLDERYKHVVQTLQDYKGAIEDMVQKLFETETIEGKTVVEIIKKYEEAHGMKSRLTDHEEPNEDINEAINKEEEKKKEAPAEEKTEETPSKADTQEENPTQDEEKKEE